MVLKLGHWKVDQKYLEMLNWGAGEGWRSFGLII
jgi:hypothetical protein